MSVRTWLSVVTVALLVIIIYLARHEIVQAWDLLGRVNLWILLLLIPGQIFVYYAAGEMVFSYLKKKKSIHHLTPPTLARMALEMNFVNHVLPSGGVSGASYMNWRLGQYGVSAGRATMAQVVRFAAGFAGFITLLLIAVVAITVDGTINRWIILLSSLLVGLMVSAVFATVFLLGSERRIKKFSQWLYITVNRVVSLITFGRRVHVLKEKTVETFFDELQDDYRALWREKKILIKPYLWGLVFTIGDVALFAIAFWALGTPVNPAIILIAYGLAVVAGFFMITPGGAGAYEAIMVFFLAMAGVSSGVAIAGILLTRVVMMVGTIALGYVFYQHALLAYGKKSKPQR